MVNSKIRDTKSDYSQSFLEAFGKNETKHIEKLKGWKFIQDSDKNVSNCEILFHHNFTNNQCMLFNI